MREIQTVNHRNNRQEVDEGLVGEMDEKDEKDERKDHLYGVKGIVKKLKMSVKTAVILPQ